MAKSRWQEWNEESLTSPGCTEYTHRVAVGVYIIDHGKLLLLLRNTTPYVWAPPGGRLLRDEDPIQGLLREIHEECGLQVEPVCPVAMWHGMHKGEALIAVFFLCKPAGGRLVLSEEHSLARWYTLGELQSQFETRTDVFGVLPDYERAFLFADVLLMTNDG